MKKLLLIAALSGTLTFAGCATTDVTPGGQIDAVIAQIQDVTKSLCRFVPTASTVASIISAGNPLVDTAAGIASGICAAVTMQTTTLDARTKLPTYRGVPLVGKHV